MTGGTVRIESGARIEARESGSGEPLLLIQSALDAEELVPLSRAAPLTERFRVIDCRRRGYGASSPVDAPGSMTADAADCAGVLHALGAVPAHVVGASYSAAVALELAALEPAAVRTLTLIEPPPQRGAAHAELLDASARLVDRFRRDGVALALEAFAEVLGAPSWLAERASADAERIARVESDATTFFGSDLPALLAWRFDAARAAPITCPVLSIGGADTHRWFVDAHAGIRELFPDCEDHVLPGAGHGAALIHSAEIAVLVAQLAARHAAP